MTNPIVANDRRHHAQPEHPAPAAHEEHPAEHPEVHAAEHVEHPVAHAEHEHNDPIEKFKTSHKSAKELLAGTEIKFMAAYVAAAEKHLKSDNGYDYSKLDVSNTSVAFAGDISNYLTAHAGEVLKSDVAHLDDVGKSLALYGVYGISSDQFTSRITSEGANYTGITHMGLSQQLQRNNSPRYIGTSTAHFTDGDKKAILKYAGLEGKVTDGVRLEDLKEIALMFNENGSVPVSYLKRKGLYKGGDDHGHDAHAHANH